MLLEHSHMYGSHVKNIHISAQFTSFNSCYPLYFHLFHKHYNTSAKSKYLQSLAIQILIACHHLSHTHTHTHTQIYIYIYMPMFCFGLFFLFFESDNFFADTAHFTLLRKETCFSKFFLEKKSGNNKNLPPKKSLCCIQFSLYLYTSPRPCYMT